MSTISVPGTHWVGRADRCGDGAEEEGDGEQRASDGQAAQDADVVGEETDGRRPGEGWNRSTVPPVCSRVKKPILLAAVCLLTTAAFAAEEKEKPAPPLGAKADALIERMCALSPEIESCSTSLSSDWRCSLSRIT